MSRTIAFLGAIARTLRAVLGVPDYDRYVEHCRAHHPGTPFMTREQFASDLLERKYGRPGNRCC